MRVTRLLILLFLVLVTCVGVAIWLVPGLRTDGPLPTSWTAVTISRETTFIEGPLDEEGYVDYVAALEAYCAQGVTPENNAAVLFWQAFGPAEVPPPSRRRFFERLGMEPPPEEGDYLVGQYEYYCQRLQAREASGEEAFGDATGADAREESIWDQYRKVSARPWSPQEFPLVAELLEEDEIPLQLVVEGSRRPRFYSPPLTDAGASQRLLMALVPAAQRCRDASQQLAARAMLRLHDGKVDEAWEDLLACHRMARLVGQAPTVVETLTAYAIDGVACRGHAALVRPGSLSAERAKRFLADFQALGPMPKMAEKMNVGERYTYLDAVAAMSRGMADVVEEMDEAPKSQLERALMNLGSRAMINWDEVLRIGNRFYDQLTEAAEKPTRAERLQALGQLEAELEAKAEALGDPVSAAKSFARMRSPRTTVGQHVGNIMLALLVPLSSAALDSEDRAKASSRLALLVFALAAHHADHGRYPERLSELSPTYLAEIPNDPFNEKAFHYERQQDGYLLYSIGPNGEDEKGRNYHADYDGLEAEDVPDDADRNSDDIAIRVPAETR